jgi:hypothetical protein
MGSFKDHVTWALWSLDFILLFIIIIIVEYPNLLVEWQNENSVSLIAILGIPFLFVVGAIFPDIDLPKDNKVTRLVFRYFIPIFTMMSVIYGLNKLYPDLMFRYFFIVALLVIFIATTLMYLIDSRSVHWGRIHSIFAGILFSTGGFLLFAMWSGMNGLIWAFISALAFFLGYLSHLMCDEWHSLKKGTKWNRRALKLWSNDWRFDPIIRIVRMIRIVR